MWLSWDTHKQAEHWRDQDNYKIVVSGEAGTGEKEEGDFETFLRSLLLSLAGVYASAGVLQCGAADHWLESGGGVYVGQRFPPCPMPNHLLML